MRFKARKFHNKVLPEYLASLFGELLVDYFAYINALFGAVSHEVREGVNKNINKIGGIFHGGLTPLLRWKFIKKFFQLFRNVFNRFIML